jgi:hypothetical protein
MVLGMVAGLLLIAAGCQSDKPWPYSPSLGPEGPACFPCSLWGGYFPTCWDRWPPDAPKCPPSATNSPPEASPGLSAPASPFTPEPTPAGKPAAGPKPSAQPSAKPPAPDSPGKEESMVEIDDLSETAAPKTLPAPEKPLTPPQSPEVPEEP